MHGPLVKQLGKNLKNVLNEQLRKKEPKLVQKINRQLEKHVNRIGLGAHRDKTEPAGKASKSK